MMAGVMAAADRPTLIQTATITATGNWNVPADLAGGKVYAEMLGASGSGGDGDFFGIKGGGGPGAGAYSAGDVPATPGGVLACVIGAGGAVPGDNLDGNNGGDTSIASNTVMAKGGSGGKKGQSPGEGVGGAGGLASASIGTTKVDGGAGGNRSTSVGGVGGTSPNPGTLTPGTPGAGGSFSTAATQGTAPGSGPGGPYSGSAALAGNRGEIKLTYYIYV